MIEKQRYFISEYAEDYFFHGGIGIIDAERVLQKKGFIAIRMPFHFSFSFGAKLSRLWYCLNLLRSVKPGSRVVFIHPLHAKLNKWLVRRLVKRKINVICMIGDINGLKDGDEDLLAEEIKELKRFSNFIVHNQAMKNWIEEKFPGSKSEMIEFFDFLTSPIEVKRNKEDRIVFAGNLDKSKFLEELHNLSPHFNLYGPGITHTMLDQANVEYHGIIDPYELPAKLTGSFGLVWDGEGITGLKGSLGSYMQFISHHKLSLYILAGLPIIVACHAGSAMLVEKYRIGICVNSLQEVQSRIAQITDANYQQMIGNMKPLAMKIAAGNCLSSALDRMMEKGS